MNNRPIKDKGGRLIIVAFLLGIIALFLPWAQNGSFRLSGFQVKGYILLLPYLYQVFKTYSQEAMNKNASVGWSFLAFIISLSYIGSRKPGLEEESLRINGLGIYLFLFSTVLLLYGSFKYNVIEEKHFDFMEEKEGEAKDKNLNPEENKLDED